MLIMPIDYVDLTDKIVVLRQGRVFPDCMENRVRRVKGGPGVKPVKWKGADNSLWLTDMSAGTTRFVRFDRKDIQGYVNDDEEAERYLMWNALKNV